MSGGKIVESFYDFDTQQIGPIRLPLNLPYLPEDGAGNRFPIYRYYEELLKDPDALAIFNLNNYCFVLVQRSLVYEVAPTRNYDPKKNKLELISWRLPEPLTVPIYNHIGYVKSKHKCLAVSQYPTYLVEDVATKELDGFTQKPEGVPLVNPPLALYKDLLKTDAEAVYFDTVEMKPKFLYN